MKFWPILKCVFIAAIVLIANAVYQSRLKADDLILVRNNGQIITSDFDPKSDENQLRIIKKTPGIILKTSHSWDAFQSMTYKGKEVSKKELIKQLPALQKEDAKRDHQLEALKFWIEPRTVLDNHQPRFSENLRYRRERFRDDRVVALNIEAYLGNWDRDAELDGLIVHLYPVNARGQIVPVDGQVEMRLVGQKYRELDARGRNDRRQFPELEEWNERVRKSDFGPNGAVVLLEFRRIRPEFHTQIADHALLTGTLGVSGQGRFDASAVDVSIRPLSRFRDEHFLRSRSRSRVNSRENYPRIR